MAADTTAVDTAMSDMMAVAADMAAADMVGEAVMATNRRRREQAMVQAINDNRRRRAASPTIGLLAVILILVLGRAWSASAQAAGQKTFSSAAEASDALAAAVQSHDQAAMLSILGPSGRDLISSGDPVADKNNEDTFAAQYRALHQFAEAGDGRTFLYVGSENWPTPIPIRQNGSQWYFDTDYGKQEILFRRIGGDELDVIKICGAIADAQRDYYSTLHDGAAIHQYAQRFHSTAGTQDGLFWQPSAAAQPPSPLGPLVAEAGYEGYQHNAAGSSMPHPFHGYVYRILTGQGSNAPGGARSYIVDGKMTGGFALLAYPASYRDSGVMTFLVDQSGQIYQKDLGPNTAQIAGAMASYDPDASWQPVNKATVAGLK